MADNNFVNRPSEPNREWVDTPTGRKKNLAYIAPKNGGKKAAADQVKKIQAATANHSTEVITTLDKGNWEPRLDTGIPATDDVKCLHRGLELFHKGSGGAFREQIDGETILETVGRDTGGAHLKNPGANGSNIAITLRSLDLIDDDNELTEHGHAVLGADKSQRDKTFGYMFSQVPETGMDRAEREKMWDKDLKETTKDNRHRILDNMVGVATANGYPPKKRTADGLERTSSAKAVESDDISLKDNEKVCQRCFLAFDSSLVENGLCVDCR